VCGVRDGCVVRWVGTCSPSSAAIVWEVYNTLWWERDKGRLHVSEHATNRNDTSCGAEASKQAVRGRAPARTTSFNHAGLPGICGCGGATQTLCTHIHTHRAQPHIGS
jgi:hypothetical protein